MRLEWIEDILAVAEEGSFLAACEKRNISQPAFSRRIRQIEQALDVTLFDRTARPARISPNVEDQLERMRELAVGMRELTIALRDKDRLRRRRIVIASQHAIAATLAPEIVSWFADLDIDTRLRSANRDDCLAQIMTRRADIAIIHDVATADPISGSDFLELLQIGNEELIPVFAAEGMTKLEQFYANGEIPVIAYPEHVFLGQVQRHVIFPRLTDVGVLRVRLETSLTLAAREFARTGFAVAWISERLAHDDIRAGRLINLSGEMPSVSMTLFAARLSDADSAVLEDVWQRMKEMAS